MDLVSSMSLFGAADWTQVALIGVQIIQAALQLGQMIYMVSLMYNLTNGAWLFEQARKYSIIFDKELVGLADKVYNIFIEILNGTLLTPEVINGFMNRIYLLVGILIFFRIALTMIKYIVSPETFLDDKVGAGNLVKRIVLGMVLIVAIPLIFTTANNLQSAIIKDRIIEKTILPDYAYNELVGKGDTGKKLAMTAFLGFFSWNSSVSPSANSLVYSNYEQVIAYKDISMFNKDVINYKHNDVFIINYIPILSTLAVGYVLYMLLKYAMELALRMLKLSFLQIIAPIVIINYMLNPRSDEAMRKWTTTTVSTYVVMFIRVMTLWFVSLMAFYLTNGIPEADGGANSLITSGDPFVKAVIVLALFAFLKDLPKLLSELLGLDLQENETINGIMRQGANALKGFAMGRIGMDFAKQQMGFHIADAATGTLSGGLNAYSGAKDKGLNKQQTGLAVASGVGTSLSSGFGNLSSKYGSVVSTNMGPTTLAPLSHTYGPLSNNPGDAEYKRASEITPRKDDSIVKDKDREKDKVKTGNESYLANSNRNNSVYGSHAYYGSVNKNNSGKAVYYYAKGLLGEKLESNNTYNLEGGLNDPVVQAVTTAINQQLFGGKQVVSVNEVAQKFQSSFTSQQLQHISQSDIISVSESIGREYAYRVTPDQSKIESIDVQPSTSSNSQEQPQPQIESIDAQPPTPPISQEQPHNNGPSNNGAVLPRSSIEKLRDRREERNNSGNSGHRNHEKIDR